MNGYERRAEEKKSNILEAAFQLLNTSKGIENLKIEELAKVAGVGKTSIFKYFGSKDNVIYEVYYRFLAGMKDEMLAIIETNQPFEITIIEITKHKMKYLEKVNKQFFLDLMDFITAKDSNGLSIMMEKYSRESFSIMLDLFHRGRKEGKVDLKYSDEFLILYFQSLVEGISSPLVYDKILPYTELWTELLLKGIAPNK